MTWFLFRASVLQGEGSGVTLHHPAGFRGNVILVSYYTQSPVLFLFSKKKITLNCYQ